MATQAEKKVVREEDAEPKLNYTDIVNQALARVINPAAASLEANTVIASNLSNPLAETKMLEKQWEMMIDHWLERAREYADYYASKMAQAYLDRIIQNNKVKAKDGEAPATLTDEDKRRAAEIATNAKTEYLARVEDFKEKYPQLTTVLRSAIYTHNLSIMGENVRNNKELAQEIVNSHALNADSDTNKL